MVSKVYECPHCEQSESVIRHGFTRRGSQRLRCKACRRAWTPEGKSRALSQEKQALIEAALEERTSQRALARTFKVARTTIRELSQKSGLEPWRFSRHAFGSGER